MKEYTNKQVLLLSIKDVDTLIKINKINKNIYLYSYK